MNVESNPTHLRTRIHSSFRTPPPFFHLPLLSPYTFPRMDKTHPRRAQVHSSFRIHGPPSSLAVVASTRRLAQTAVPAQLHDIARAARSPSQASPVGPQCGNPSLFEKERNFIVYRTLFVRFLPYFALGHLFCSPSYSARYLSPECRTSPHEHISFPSPFPSAQRTCI